MDNSRNRPASIISSTSPQNSPAGSITDKDVALTLPTLFTSLKIRGLNLHNRIFVSPMCQYSADDGHLTDWHMAHLGGFLQRGPGLTMIEATAVTANGRISPNDSGLWKDSQVESLKRIVDFAHSQGQKIGIQLAHAGRKASSLAPWIRPGGIASAAANGWPDDIVGPSTVPFGEGYPLPKALTKREINEIVEAFALAAKRAVRAGIDVIEIHGAHGYLIHSFQSPVSNKRTDEYGGSFENRIKFTVKVVDAVRTAMPAEMPLFFRVSATDWLEESLPDTPSWKLEDTVKLAKVLTCHGVDLLDISSGGSHPKQLVKGGFHAPAYQAFLAKAIKDMLGDKLLVGAVGGIRDPFVAEDLLRDTADVVLIGRQFLKNPGTVWEWADRLGVGVKMADQLEWGFPVQGRLLP